MPQTLFAQLDVDHARLLDCPAASAALARWRSEDPALAPYAPWVEVQAAAHDRTDPARADRVLAALARRAGGDQLAAQLLLGLLLPGVKALAVRLWWLVDLEERAAAAVAATFERIRTYPFERRPARIAANVLADARQQLTRAARGQLADADQVPLDDVEGTRLPSVEAAPEPSAREELLGLLRWAVRTGALTVDQARLIGASRLADVPCEVLGEQVGLGAHSLRRRRQRAERALALAITGQVRAPAGPAGPGLLQRSA
jgi:hypothetical protein